MRWLLVLATSLASHADSVKCRGRCVLLEPSRDAAARSIYVDDLGLVEGVDLKVLAGECDALAAVRPEKLARGYVVDNISIAPAGSVKTVVDYRAKTTCDHDVNAPPVSEHSFGKIAAGVVTILGQWVMAFFNANVYR